MKVTITSAQIQMPVEDGLTILGAKKPVDALKAYIMQKHDILPDGVGDYDVQNVRKAIVVGLGERELERLEKTGAIPAAIAAMESETTP